MTIFDLGETGGPGSPGYTGPDSGNSGSRLAQPITLAVSAKLISLSIYIETVAGQVNLGLYEDNGGNPNQAIVTTGLFTPTTGWNTIPIEATLGATDYWIAFAPDDNGLEVPGFSGSLPFIKGINSITPGDLPFLFSASGNVGIHFSLYATFDDASGETYLGTTTVGTNTDSGNGGGAISNEYTLSASGLTVRSISVFTTVPGTGLVNLAIYTNNGGGQPGIIVAQTDLFTPTVGWNTVQLRGIVPLDPDDYWLAFAPEQNDYENQFTPGAATFISSVTLSPAGTFLQLWTTSGSGSAQFSMYATLYDPTAADEIYIGSPEIFGNHNDFDGGHALANQYTLSADATLESISFYVDAVGGSQLNLGFYSDNGAGQPTGLLAETGIFTPVVGWNTMTVAVPYAALASTLYWLAFAPELDALGDRADFSGSFISSALATPSVFENPWITVGSGSAIWSLFGTLSTSAPPPMGDLLNGIFFGAGSTS